MLKNFDEDWNEISGMNWARLLTPASARENIILLYIQPIMIKYGEKYPTN